MPRFHPVRLLILAVVLALPGAPRAQSAWYDPWGLRALQLYAQRDAARRVERLGAPTHPYHRPGRYGLRDLERWNRDFLYWNRRHDPAGPRHPRPWGAPH